MPVIETTSKRKPFKAFAHHKGGRVQLGTFSDRHNAVLAVAIAREILEPDDLMVAKFNNPALRASVELRINAYMDSGDRKYSEPL